MTSSWQSSTLVGFQSGNRDRYKRNFLRQAVCEFRFPTLLELGRTKPPESFVKALRKEYPLLDLVKEVQIGFGGEPSGTVNKHLLRSMKGKWSVSIKESAISVETTAYTGYAELKGRILPALAAAAKIIDSEFFTRVGLRYINLIEAEDGADPVVSGWVNKDLVGPLLPGHFSGIAEYSGRLALNGEDGGCLLQHGLQFKQRQHPEETPEVIPGYSIDIDVYRNVVTLDQVDGVLDEMHSQAFNIFDWTLGDESRNYLSQAKKAG